MSIYSCDFESTSENQYNIENKTKVWLANCCDIDTLQHFTFYNLDDFFIWVQKTNHYHDRKTLYFHNLKFDGDFIINWLLRNNFKHSTEKKLNEREFSTIISDMGIWYGITICFKVYNKKKLQVKIFDSYKKLPFSVDKIAKSFNLPLEKLKIDYNKIIPNDYIPNDLEIQYIKNDCEIIARALKIQFEKNLNKITIGSDALNEFKNIFGKEKYKYLFPQFDYSIDCDLRKTYKGGYVYLNPLHKNKMLENISTYDVNSLYPYVMYEKLLPYGTPIYFKGKYKKDNQYPLFLQYLLVDFELKENHIPTVQEKGNLRFIPNEYIISTENEPIYLFLTNIDLEIFLKHYNIKSIEYIEGYKFKGNNDFFKEYINKWSKIKMNSVGAERELAKLMLNNLYGKFGTNPKRCNLIPQLINDEVKYIKGVEEIGKMSYVAMASFITAYARQICISTAQENYKNFVYCDTDSLHIIDNDKTPNINIDSKKLGYWKYEGTATKAKYLKAKSYIKLIEGKIKVTCAGLPDKVKEQVNFTNFNIGSCFKGKLLAKKVKGGTILKDTEFTIK